MGGMGWRRVRVGMGYGLGVWVWGMGWGGVSGGFGLGRGMGGCGLGMGKEEYGTWVSEWGVRGEVEGKMCQYWGRWGEIRRVWGDVGRSMGLDGGWVDSE